MNCELCDSDIVYVLDTGDTVFVLCPNHLESLVNYNLTVDEVKQLRQTHGDKTFYLHNDFYDEEGRSVVEDA